MTKEAKAFTILAALLLGLHALVSIRQALGDVTPLAMAPAYLLLGVLAGRTYRYEVREQRDL